MTREEITSCSSWVFLIQRLKPRAGGHWLINHCEFRFSVRLIHHTRYFQEHAGAHAEFAGDINLTLVHIDDRSRTWAREALPPMRSAA